MFGCVIQLVAILISIAYLFIPLCTLAFEVEIVILSLLFLTNLIGGNVVLIILRLRRRSLVGYKYVKGISVLFLIASLAIGLDRVKYVSRDYSTFNGVVTEKYISKNHGVKGIITSNKKIEPIDEKLWKNLFIGDSLLKNSCCDTVLQFRYGKYHSFMLY